MKAEDIRKGMTVTVRPAVKGVARFDAIVDSVHGNFVRVLRGEKEEVWTVGAHECQPYDGMTDFQRKIATLVKAVKSISIEDITVALDTFSVPETNRERGAQEASVLRAVKRHPLSNYVEAKRLEGKNKKERKMMLYWKDAQ